MGKLLPGRTVAVRFTLMYAAVFLMSGIGLLTLTNLLAAGRSTDVVPAPGMTGRQPGLVAARQRIEQLEGQRAPAAADDHRYDAANHRREPP